MATTPSATPTRPIRSAGLSSNQIEFKYTLYGDTNLDGIVNSVDFGNLAANFGKSGKVWDQGDFNYDGVVNSIDFGNLAANFGKSASGADITLPSADWAAVDAFAAANGLTSDVPEPGSAALALMVGMGILARRRGLRTPRCTKSDKSKDEHSTDQHTEKHIGLFLRGLRDLCGAFLFGGIADASPDQT